MIKPGDYVRVVDGIFKGRTGVVLAQYEREYAGENIWEVSTGSGDVLIRESRLEVLP